MGKNLIQQARGKGGPRYRAPSFRYKGQVKHLAPNADVVKGRIISLITCQGHNAPLAEIKLDNNEYHLIIAPEGIREGDMIEAGDSAEIRPGSLLPLKNVPEGTLVYDIESRPGDGGKFCRSSGTFARVLGKTGDSVTIQFPSKKQKTLGLNCRACIGTVAGSGRKEKPMLKAGKKHYAKKAKNKLYPIVSGNAQNAVDHPFGNSRSQRKSKARPTSRNAPPGRKVGMISARRSGRKK